MLVPNYSLIKSVHITEKAVRGSDKNRQYTFKVCRTASKPQVKAVIEDFFKVIVEKVNTINVLGKGRKFRQKNGKRQDWKKAYVTLSEGHEINLVDLNKGN